ncbi:hypothetical protein HLRTI_001264 [Halorhabdus tiamatea SARL4B]|uniref:Uncharacterized protein n=1 Tax=Halorhabdus tiamatea SARL4B TaxID=1033806 RepID=U2FEJ4_9EURY|nr:hypothetical protein HLRTI_001264 [Halorhabdus tiamatea SARL4B]
MPSPADKRLRGPDAWHGLPTCRGRVRKKREENFYGATSGFPGCEDIRFVLFGGFPDDLHFLNI